MKLSWIGSALPLESRKTLILPRRPMQMVNNDGSGQVVETCS